MAGQAERLARVRLTTRPPRREDSRRRMAGGELRLGTASTYMGIHYHIMYTICKLIMLYTWVHRRGVKEGNLGSTAAG